MGATPQILLGRYELGPLLGAGGMAEVFEGHDRLLARRVAIKILLAQYAHDPAFLARFRREAQSAASLSHPNIVGVFDTGSEGDTWFIVMEYVDGRTLKDIIRAEGALYWARAAEVAADVAGALAVAHARGIVHRDVKPGNVMLTTEGKVKVMDFGIARATAVPSITQTSAAIGAAGYGEAATSLLGAGGTVAGTRAARYAEGVPEQRRGSLGWVLAAILALVVVGLAAFFITRAVTSPTTSPSTASTAPSTTP